MKKIYILLLMVGITSCFNDRTTVEKDSGEKDLPDMQTDTKKSDAEPDLLNIDTTSDFKEDTCNNGVLEIKEACDSFELRDKTCVTEGFDDGALSCSDACTLDLEGCFSCGDESLHESEYCDGELLGAHTCSEQLGFASHGTLVCKSDCTSVDKSLCELNYLQVSADSTAHSCGVKSDGTGFCWGNNLSGQTDVPAGKYSEIITGYQNSCGLRIDGTIVCWGNDNSERNLSPAGQFTAIGMGLSHSCAIKVDGMLACWGRNSSSQTDEPVGTFIMVGAGFDFSCGLRSDKTIECWGNDDNGQSTPPPGSFLTIDIGQEASCGIRENGTAVCWGKNVEGQYAIPAGLQFDFISPGYRFMCGITKSQNIQCWGGAGEKLQSPAGEYVKISSGESHSCAISIDGVVRCWGRNTDGQSTPP